MNYRVYFRFTFMLTSALQRIPIEGIGTMLLRPVRGGKRAPAKAGLNPARQQRSLTFGVWRRMRFEL